jgi:imidazole glycerol-phosphate synthase subunit HisF
VIKKRVIARLDIKNEFIIKGVHLEGLRKIGNPNKTAYKYYLQGIDELVFMDAVAAYYDRNSLLHIIKEACHDVFVPITVGGGLRNLNDIQNALNAGADKVAINTKAISEPLFLEAAAKKFGSQSIVSSIVAKKTSNNNWEAYTDNGREPSGKNVIEWAKEVEDLGAGEIMITSIDADGTKKGFDIQLNEIIASNSCIPIIASGGAGSNDQIIDLIKHTNVDAVAVASILHYDISDVKSIKTSMRDYGFQVRL